MRILALFSKQNITSEDDAQLDTLSNMTALIIQADRIDGDAACIASDH